MKIGDYVRTKQRGFQFPQIARIKSMSRDEGYKNQYFIELDHNLLPDYEYRIYEEDIDKSSPNIIDLIEVGDYVNGFPIQLIYQPPNEKIGKLIVYDTDNVDGWDYDPLKFEEKEIETIITKEQIEKMEYKVGEDNE